MDSDRAGYKQDIPQGEVDFPGRGVNLRKRNVVSKSSKGPLIITAKKEGPVHIFEDPKVSTSSDREDEEEEPDEETEEKKEQPSGKRMSVPRRTVTTLPRVPSPERTQTAPPVKQWITADTQEEHDVSFIILSMRDFVIYLLYLCLVLMITFGERDKAFNYYASIISDLIVESDFPVYSSETPVQYNFRTTENVLHFWSFIENVLCKVIYGDGDNKQTAIEESILFGSPQMRQIRVTRNSCITAPLFEDLYKTCYGYYTVEEEDKSPFGLKNSTPWQYEFEETGRPYLPGSFGYYSAGGYTFNFTSDTLFTEYWIAELKRHNWIDLATRAIFIDFTLYSPNVRLFCVTQLAFEVSPSGFVVTRTEFRTLKMLKYNTPWSFFVLSCELVFVLFTLYFTAEEAQQIYLLKTAYFRNSWNILDLFIICMSITTIAFGANRLLYTATYIPDRIANMHIEGHSDFENISYQQANFNLLFSITAFTAWLKLMKFSALNQSVFIILSALGNVVFELISLILMTVVISIGFSILGMNIFGAHVVQFSTFRDSMFTLNGLYVGGLHFYENCARFHPIIAPTYFCVYILIVVIFFLNGFLALIIHGTHLSIEDEEDSPDRKYLSDVAREAFIRSLVRLKLYPLMKRFRGRELLQERRQEYDSFVRVLERNGCRGHELNLILQEYKIKSDDRINFNQMREAYEDVCARKQLYMEVEGHNQIMAEVGKIEKVVEACDQTVLDIMNKVEILTDAIFGAPRSLKGKLKH